MEIKKSKVKQTERRKRRMEMKQVKSRKQEGGERKGGWK